VRHAKKLTNMKISCIGWGSLIWKPGKLNIENKWFEDGPLLPIEFTRQSDNGRMTLIIDNAAKPVRTLWALMTSENIHDAIKSLKEREGTSTANIHNILKTDSTEDSIKLIVKNWLVTKDLDGAVWTGLSYRNGVRPSIEQVINQLLSLNHAIGQEAEEYIRKAPKQIDTEYRRSIEKELGWTAIE